LFGNGREEKGNKTGEERKGRKREVAPLAVNDLLSRKSHISS